MTGTVLSQILNIIFIPVLARIYSPADYGVTGAIISIATILAAIVTLSLQHGIILAEDDDKAKTVVRVNVYLGLLTCAFFFTIFIFTRHYLANEIFSIKSLENWILLVPFYTFFSSLFIVFQVYANRLQFYKDVSSSRVISVVSNLGTAFILALIFKNEFGLIAGLILGQLFAFLFLIWRIYKRTSGLFIPPSGAEFMHIINLYKKFPLYSMPSELLNSFTTQLPVVMLSHYTTTAIVGQYNMSNRILGLPSVFISSAITDVFKQRAAKDFVETGTYRPIFLKTFKILSLLSVIPFLIIGIFGSDIFKLFLGDEWAYAGRISQILAIMYLFNFIVSPLSYVIYISGKNWFSFLIDLLRFVGSYFIFATFLYNVDLAIGLYALLYIVLSVFILLFCYFLNDKKRI